MLWQMWQISSPSCDKSCHLSVWQCRVWSVHLIGKSGNNRRNQSMWSKISENVPEIGIFEKSTFWKKLKRRKFWLSTLKYHQSTIFGSFEAITPRLMGFSPQILFHCNLFNTWNKVKCYFDITNEGFHDFLKIFYFIGRKSSEIDMKIGKNEQ